MKMQNKDTSKLALAISLFKKGDISIGRAASMLEKNTSEVITLFSNMGIPLTGNKLDEAKNDMQNARRFLKQ